MIMSKNKIANRSVLASTFIGMLQTVIGKKSELQDALDQVLTPRKISALV